MDNYLSTPLGALVQNPEEEDFYLALFVKMPLGVKKLVQSTTTAAFLRGLLKNHRLDENGVYSLSFLVLQVASGRVKLEQLAGQISSKLSLPNDKAQIIANEIVADLFDPIKSELSEFLVQIGKDVPGIEAEQRADQGGAMNVLNLKQEQKPPTPPWREAR